MVSSDVLIMKEIKDLTEILIVLRLKLLCDTLKFEHIIDIYTYNDQKMSPSILKLLCI